MHQSLARFIDYLFYHEREIREKYKMILSDRRENRFTFKPSTLKRGDPTASIAMRNTLGIKRIGMRDGSVLRAPELCLRLIDETYDNASKCVFEIALMKYAGLTGRLICERRGLTKEEYDGRINEFRTLAIEIGLRKKMFEKILKKDIAKREIDC